jgi:DNA-binding NtrC family response regulator
VRVCGRDPRLSRSGRISGSSSGIDVRSPGHALSWQDDRNRLAGFRDVDLGRTRRRLRRNAFKLPRQRNRLVPAPDADELKESHVPDSQSDEEFHERVLVVEDDSATRVGLQQLIRNWGFVVEAAKDGEEALQMVTTFRPGIVITDLVMPRMDGLALLRALQEQSDDVTTVILTAQGTVETAVEAIKVGAYDYLTKPIDLQRMRILLDKIVERQGTLREVKALRRQLREQGAFGSIIGNSPTMRKVYYIIEQAAPTSASVLVSGESGTGKELVARTIHQLSPRAAGAYVPVTCAAIPETLLESEIFGHEKGAFTGAFERRQGCFELANRGTLFLDEIAEMTMATQVKLLRVLQERSFRRLGGRDEQTVDVRVIAATNADPPEAVERGKLREDLYYRLNVFAIKLPPLRDRMEDLPLLIQAFISEFNARNGRSVVAVDQPAMRILETYAWPGNVRELRNVIEHATILAKDRFIETRHLPLSLWDAGRGHQPGPTLKPGMTVDEAERRLILMTLEYTKDNKTRAATMLGFSLKTLYNKLKRLRITEKDEGGEA